MRLIEAFDGIHKHSTSSSCNIETEIAMHEGFLLTANALMSEKRQLQASAKKQFYACFKDVLDSMGELDGGGAERNWSLPELAINNEAYKDYKIVITGHSLGAGVATAIAVLAIGKHMNLLTNHKIECYAICPPGCTMTRRLADWTNAMGCFHSLVNGNDLVPRLSRNAGRQLVERIHAHRWLSKVARRQQTWCGNDSSDKLLDKILSKAPETKTADETDEAYKNRVEAIALQRYAQGGRWWLYAESSFTHKGTQQYRIRLLNDLDNDSSNTGTGFAFDKKEDYTKWPRPIPGARLPFLKHYCAAFTSPFVVTSIDKQFQFNDEWTRSAQLCLPIPMTYGIHDLMRDIDKWNFSPMEFCEDQHESKFRGNWHPWYHIFDADSLLGVSMHQNHIQAQKLLRLAMGMAFTNVGFFSGHQHDDINSCYVAQYTLQDWISSEDLPYILKQLDLSPTQEEAQEMTEALEEMSSKMAVCENDENSEAYKTFVEATLEARLQLTDKAQTLRANRHGALAEDKPAAGEEAREEEERSNGKALFATAKELAKKFGLAKMWGRCKVTECKFCDDEDRCFRMTGETQLPMIRAHCTNQCEVDAEREIADILMSKVPGAYKPDFKDEPFEDRFAYVSDVDKSVIDRKYDTYYGWNDDAITIRTEEFEKRGRHIADLQKIAEHLRPEDEWVRKPCFDECTWSLRLDTPTQADPAE
jgi:hypothetical protein